MFTMKCFLWRSETRGRRKASKPNAKINKKLAGRQVRLLSKSLVLFINFCVTLIQELPLLVTEQPGESLKRPCVNIGMLFAAKVLEDPSSFKQEYLTDIHFIMIPVSPIPAVIGLNCFEKKLLK